MLANAVDLVTWELVQEDYMFEASPDNLARSRLTS